MSEKNSNFNPPADNSNKSQPPSPTPFVQPSEPQADNNQQQPTSTNQQAPINNQEPKTSNQKPITTPPLAGSVPVQSSVPEQNKPATSQQSQTTSNQQQPPINNQKSAISNQEPKTSNQKPITTPPLAESAPVQSFTPEQNKESTTSNQQSTINNQKPKTSNQKPITTSQPPEIIQGAPTKPGDKIESEEKAQNISNPATSFVNSSLNSVKAVGTTNKSNLFPQGQKPDSRPLDGEEKMFAAIGYISFLALVPLLARRDSEFCQHHGRQGLTIFIIFVFLWILANFVGPLAWIIGILQIVAVVGGFLLSYKGEWFCIPGVYDLSLKLKIPQK